MNDAITSQIGRVGVAEVRRKLRQLRFDIGTDAVPLQ